MSSTATTTTQEQNGGRTVEAATTATPAAIEATSTTGDITPSTTTTTPLKTKQPTTTTVEGAAVSTNVTSTTSPPPPPQQQLLLLPASKSSPSTKLLLQQHQQQGPSSSQQPPSSIIPIRLTKEQQEHEDFKNKLVEEVLGEGAGDRVPMEKVVMLLWQFRDDPTVVSFMAKFMAKYSGVRHVLDGIEFYLPQLAHMIIHLEVEWDDDILERFALIVAQQSIHFALQLNWILQGALQDYQPELDDGTQNETYNRIYYIRCLKILRNIERCVVYGKPRAQALQRLYEQGKITKQELQIMEHADRRFVALHLTTQEAEEKLNEQQLDGWMHIILPTTYKKGLIPHAQSSQNLLLGNSNTNTNNFNESLQHLSTEEAAKDEEKSKTNGSSSSPATHSSEYVYRYCVLERHILNVYSVKGGCSDGSIVLDRAMSLAKANVESYGSEDSYQIKIETARYDLKLRCSSREQHRLWVRRLQEESYMSVLFQKKDAKLREDLSPAQLDRYNFFDNERQFVNAITEIAEVLRDKDRAERKELAPILMGELQIPETVYLPLCNSSDIWRRVAVAIPNETRVFNTKARCPVIMNFISRRGECHKRGGGRIDSNLDIAEYLHLYFEVAPETMEGVAEDAEGEEEKIEVGLQGRATMLNKNGVQDSLRSSEHDGSGAWALDDVDDDGPPAVGNNIKGNKKVQRLLRESVITLPNKLARRLQPRSNFRRNISVMDKQTKMQPMVPILEGGSRATGMDIDTASVCESLSVGRTSIQFKDRLLHDDVENGDIDIECINRAKKFVSNNESWAEKSVRMLEAAQKTCEEAGESSVQLEIASCMSKSNDDLRQEVFVMQMIHYYKSVFALAKLPLWLKTYRILSCSSSTGLLEVLTDATSLDGLKKSDGYPYTEGGLRKYFEMVYGPPDSPSFKAAQTNFMQSLAAYGLVSYLLGLKDRHNGNIMIDTRGHLIFIDFGFAMGMAPGHEFSMERAPFKLTKEYVDLMGGTNSECYKEFERLFVEGFVECRNNSQIALGLVEIMMYKSNYPCFSGWRYGKGKALLNFEKRLMLRVPDNQIKVRAKRLVRQARGHWGTYLYDVFQKKSNGYAI